MTKRDNQGVEVEETTDEDKKELKRIEDTKERLPIYRSLSAVRKR